MNKKTKTTERQRREILERRWIEIEASALTAQRQQQSETGALPSRKQKIDNRHIPYTGQCTPSRGGLFTGGEDGLILVVGGILVSGIGLGCLFL